LFIDPEITTGIVQPGPFSGEAETNCFRPTFSTKPYNASSYPLTKYPDAYFPHFKNPKADIVISSVPASISSTMGGATIEVFSLDSLNGTYTFDLRKNQFGGLILGSTPFAAGTLITPISIIERDVRFVDGSSPIVKSDLICYLYMEVSRVAIRLQTNDVLIDNFTCISAFLSVNIITQFTSSFAGDSPILILEPNDWTSSDRDYFTTGGFTRAGHMSTMALHRGGQDLTEPITRNLIHYNSSTDTNEGSAGSISLQVYDDV
jgi:hypothetical protein